jgi:cephalosporin hydroxylase
MLAMLDYCEAVEAGTSLDPRKSRRRVVGIDIDIRLHNRSAIGEHPLSGLITMVEGSSVDQHVIDEVHQLAAGHETVMVFMDSNHTHEHVLGELNAYAHLVTKGSYCVVFDTFVEDMPPKYFPDRPWDKGDSPKTAVREYLKSHSEFEIDKSIDNKLLISVAPDGYLLRIA